MVGISLEGIKLFYYSDPVKPRKVSVCCDGCVVVMIPFGCWLFLELCLAKHYKLQL